MKKASLRKAKVGGGLFDLLGGIIGLGKRRRVRRVKVGGIKKPHYTFKNGVRAVGGRRKRRGGDRFYDDLNSWAKKLLPK